MPNLKWLDIPSELTSRGQWAVASMARRPDGRLDKAPRHPRTGETVSVTDPDAWATFEEVINSGYPAIGFILTSSDPLAVIDLDHTDDPTNIARQIKIYENFTDTYSERSISGRGLHIICCAKFGGGVRRDSVEIYDQERFIICTGDFVMKNPLANKQGIIDQLVKEMGGVEASYPAPVDLPEKFSDDEIITKALAAKNGDRFRRLFFEPPGPEDDWSQLDASLAQHIAFWTRNHEQALRLFRRSKLYRPESKGKSITHYEQYYLMRTFSRAWRLEQQRDADIETGKEMASRLLARQQAGPCAAEVELPAGIVGDVARFIYAASERPVMEIALAGAITFCSGVFGRQYNISRTGLNLYTVLIAETGRGKESAARGAEMLMTALQSQIPAMGAYRGPAHIASGQGLIRRLDESPAFFSFIGEFSHMLHTITNPKANSADIRTKQVLLDLFSKSGRFGRLLSSVYSDTDKNTKEVQSPNFAFMGDTTPGSYFELLSSRMISEGLIPRFLTIQYVGPRVARNTVPVQSPPPELVERLLGVCSSIINMAYQNTVVDIQLSDQARRLLDDFDHRCDERINAGGPLVEVWNRAHLKALRLAGLVAVGCNHYAPEVDEAAARWAVQLITSDIAGLERVFEAGEVGEGEARHESYLIKAIRAYPQLSPDTRINTYKVPVALAERGDIIPYSYFRRRLKQVAEFQQARNGLVSAIKHALADACETGILQKLTDAQVVELNQSGQGRKLSGEYYTIGSQLD